MKLTQHTLPLSRIEAERLERAGQLETFLEQRQFRVALRSALQKYVDRERDRLLCQHCGVPNSWRSRVIWHHPDNDGHLGRVTDLVNALATIERIDAEIARCVPLCHSCHSKEHIRMRQAADDSVHPEKQNVRA